mgnify:CR=1 FL=1
MIYKGKECFFKTGLLFIFGGFFSIIIGYMAVPKVWFQSIYLSDIYWPIAIGTIGVGLLVLGLFILVIGVLRVR